MKLFSQRFPRQVRDHRLPETIPEAERVRFLRAKLVTSLPGGPGNVPAGIKTGVQGTLLKRDW